MQRIYLVIRADRSVRVAKRPRLCADEIAVEINLSFPEVWGTVVSTMDINVPDFAPVVNPAAEERDRRERHTRTEERGGR